MGQVTITTVRIDLILVCQTYERLRRWYMQWKFTVCKLGVKMIYKFEQVRKMMFETFSIVQQHLSEHDAYCNSS